MKQTPFLRLAAERYSCRGFSSEPVIEADIQTVLEAARLAPTAVNRQPVHVWVLRSPQARARAAEATPYTFDAPVIFVVGCRPDEAWVRKYDGHNEAEIDAAIVGTHIMMQVADLGLGATWVGSFDPARLLAAFPEMTGYTPVALFPMGHPAKEPSERHFQRKSPEVFSSEL